MNDWPVPGILNDSVPVLTNAKHGCVHDACYTRGSTVYLFSLWTTRLLNRNPQPEWHAYIVLVLQHEMLECLA